MRHLLIPDTQILPGVCVNHLNALGNFIVEKQPEVIVCIGDFADMHSLSSYDMGRRSGEGARYEEDINASKAAMETLLAPLHAYNHRRRRNKEKMYRPRMVMTLGNHENRINRHVDSYPVLEGRLSTDDLGFKEAGWEVYPFLEVVDIDGILYSHYFPRNADGNIVQTNRGAPNARTQVQREQQSCTSGHKQGLSFHVQQLQNRRHYGLMAGSFYLHDCDYLSPQGTAYWRGIILKENVREGEYDPVFIRDDNLIDRYWDGKHVTV